MQSIEQHYYRETEEQNSKYEWSAGKNVNLSYRDISVVVAENNGVVKPKCQQELR